MGAIGKGINDFIGGDTGEGSYKAQTEELINRIKNEWELPEYDQTPLTPKEYALLNQYAPQIAGFVQQQAPQLLSNISGPGQKAQQQSLDQLSQLSKTGVDAGMQAQLEEAGMSADQALRSSKANALAALASRGLGSSGATLGADIAASLGAAEQQRKMSLEAASQAAQRKAQAIQGLGSLGSQVAGQEQQKEEFNANTLNQYNQLLANRRQQYNNYAAQTQNQANMYNQQQIQGTANANTGLSNQYNQFNRARDDRNRENLANSKNQRLQLESGLQAGMNQQELAYNQERARNATSTMMGLAGIPGAIYNFSGSGKSSYRPNQGASDAGIGEQYTGGGYVTDTGGGGMSPEQLFGMGSTVAAIV